MDFCQVKWQQNVGRHLQNKHFFTTENEQKLNTRQFLKHRYLHALAKLDAAEGIEAFTNSQMMLLSEKEILKVSIHNIQSAGVVLKHNKQLEHVSGWCGHGYESHSQPFLLTYPEADLSL